MSVYGTTVRHLGHVKETLTPQCYTRQTYQIKN